MSAMINGEPAALFAALAAAKASELWKSPSRNREVKVKPRKRDDGYQPPDYTFKYATLDELIDCTEKALAANGLTVIQLDFETDGKYVMRTILAHSSGSSLEFERPIEFRGSNQERGSALTYARRYSYGLALCLAADDDDDANAADGNDVTSKSDRQRPPEPKREQPRKPQAAPRTPDPTPPPQKPANDQKPVPEAPQGRPQARNAPAQKPLMAQARELLSLLGYTAPAGASQEAQAEAREAGSDRMQVLVGKRFGETISEEEMASFVSGLRNEKLVTDHLKALGYGEHEEGSRLQSDYGEEEPFQGIRQMGQVELARALQSLEAEAKAATEGAA